MELNIFHMYPDLLNLYGDIGNVTCLKKRCEWRGIKINIVDFSLANEAGYQRCRHTIHGRWLRQGPEHCLLSLFKV